MNKLPASAAVNTLTATRLATASVDRVDADGAVWICFEDGPPQQARVAAPPPPLHMGTPVVVLLEPDRAGLPVIVSTVLDRVPTSATVDVEAGQRLTLRCGDASIELRADGTIEIHGERVESHAEGIQRIKGAQVRIN